MLPLRAHSMRHFAEAEKILQLMLLWYGLLWHLASCERRPIATKPTSYNNLGEIIRDFCRNHEVTLIPGPIVSQQTSAAFGEMLHSANCLTSSARIDNLRDRHEGPPWNLVLFPDPVKRYKLLLLWESIGRLNDVLAQTSLLSSQISMVCQLSFKTQQYSDIPVHSPLEFSRCNVLAIDDQAVVRNPHKMAIEHNFRDYTFRLWALSEQPSICSQCGIIQNHRELNWYKGLSGLKLNVGAVHNTPHWRLRDIPNHHGTDSRGGIEQAYVILLSRYFNFTYDVVPDAESKFGGLDGDKWSGMIGQVHRKDVDFALGGLSVFYFRFLFIDFVYPYITDVFAFVAKAPTRIPLTQAIVYPFQKQVWMALFGSLLAAWSALVLVRRWTPQHQQMGSEPDVWLLFATLVRQSDWSSGYRTLSFRSLLTAWLLLALVASNSYSCLLLSFMSVPAFSPRVDTPEKLQEAILEGRYTAGTSNGTAQYILIMEAREGPTATVRTSMLGRPDLLVPNKQRGLAMALRENYAYIDTRRGLRSALHDLHAKSLEVSSGHVGTTLMSLATHKTCFYRGAFNTMSRRLVESGHFLKWEREDQPARPKRKQSQFKDLELSDVYSHGTILIAGYCLALLALAGEYARSRYTAKATTRHGNLQEAHCPVDSSTRKTANSMDWPRLSRKPPQTQQHQQQQERRRRGGKRSAVATAPAQPSLPPVNWPRRWETRVVGQSGFKRVSINLGSHAFPKTGDPTVLGTGPSGGHHVVAHRVGTRHGCRLLPRLPPVST